MTGGKSGSRSSKLGTLMSSDCTAEDSTVFCLRFGNRLLKAGNLRLTGYRQPLSQPTSSSVDYWEQEVCGETILGLHLLLNQRRRRTEECLRGWLLGPPQSCSTLPWLPVMQDRGGVQRYCGTPTTFTGMSDLKSLTPSVRAALLQAPK